MFAKNKKVIILLFTLVLIFSTSTVLPQYDPEYNSKPRMQDQGTADFISDHFDKVPVQYWLKIDAFGTVSLLIVLIAFILGLVSFFMGWNAGGRQNVKVIKKSIISGVFIALIARPFKVWIHYWIDYYIIKITPDAFDPVASAIVGIAMYILWSAYLVAIPVFLYEVFTVTAKEAYPPR